MKGDFMKHKFSVICFSVILSIASLSFLHGDSGQVQPNAVILDGNYKFEQIPEGTKIVHDFIIQNIGAATLDIQRVHTDWGCATVSFSKQIPAGGEGKVTISFNTKGYGGKPVKKNIAVYTNDPEKPKINLTLRGFVDKIVDITPKRVFLNGSPDKELSASVTIVPEEKYPFKIKEVKAQSGYNISVKLENDGGSKPNQYIVTVKNTAKTKNKYYDWIIIRTDSAVNNEIKIPVVGNIF